jgi:ABC-type polysaccharide/polyol phosphate export permease
VALGALYWSVPIIYPYSMVPESKRIFFEINPIFLAYEANASSFSRTKIS